MNEHSAEEKTRRFKLWLTIPPTWFLMAYVEKHGVSGDFTSITDYFRDVVHVKRAMMTAPDIDSDLDYYLRELEEFETRTGANCIKIGQAAARERGVHFGRPPLAETKIEAAKTALIEGLSIRVAAKKVGVSTATIQRIKKTMTTTPKN